MKTLIKWIEGFGLDSNRENELIQWAKEAYGVLSIKEIKAAIQEKINYNY